MELNLSWLRSLTTVCRYIWCAAVTNIFVAGIIYTASLAGAQVNAVKELRELRAGLSEAVQDIELTRQEKRDHAVAKR